MFQKTRQTRLIIQNLSGYSILVEIIKQKYLKINIKIYSFNYAPSNNLLTRQTPPILDFKRYFAIDNNTTDKTPQTLVAEKTTPVLEKSTTTSTESYETKQENKAAKLETLANVKPSYMDRTKAFLKPLPGKIWHEIVYSFI